MRIPANPGARTLACTNGNQSTRLEFIHTQQSSSFLSKTKASSLTFDGEIKRARHHPLPVCVKIKRHNLRRVAQERVQALARLDVEDPVNSANVLSLAPATGAMHAVNTKTELAGDDGDWMFTTTDERKSGRSEGPAIWQARTHTLLGCFHARKKWFF